MPGPSPLTGPGRGRADARPMIFSTLLGWVPSGIGGDVVSLVLLALLFAVLLLAARGLERV